MSTTSTDLFEQASRLKVRFDSPKGGGGLTVEDLWDLPLTSPSGRSANLDSIAIALHRATREAAETVSFVTAPASNGNSELQLKFDLVRHIIAVRVAERDQAKDLADRKAKKDRLLELIARKQDEELASKSVEELTALVQSL